MTQASNSSGQSSAPSITLTEDSIVKSTRKLTKVRDINIPDWPCIRFQYTEPSTLVDANKEHDALQAEAKSLQTRLQEAERRIYNSGGSHESFLTDISQLISLSHQILEVKILLLSNWYTVGSNYSNKEFNPKIRRGR